MSLFFQPQTHADGRGREEWVAGTMEAILDADDADSSDESVRREAGEYSAWPGCY